MFGQPYFREARMAPASKPATLRTIANLLLVLGIGMIVAALTLRMKGVGKSAETSLVWGAFAIFVISRGFLRASRRYTPSPAPTTN